MFVLQGYYAFLDYAVQHWYDHLQAAVDSKPTLRPTKWLEAVASARKLLETHGSSTISRHWDNEQDVEGVVRTFKEIPTDGRERNAHFDIELRTSSIRNRIESCHSQSLAGSLSDAFVNLHSNTMLFKCPKPWCDDFLHGFENIHDRKSHVSRHILPFACPNMECFAFHLGYETQSRLDDHIKRHHLKPTAAFEFPQKTPKKSPDIVAAVQKGRGATAMSLLDSMRSSHLDAVNARYGRSNTNLLYEAVNNNHFDICKSLLERGADTDYKDANRNSALHIAAKKGFADIVHLILGQSNCEPDETDFQAWSAFNTACAFGHLEVVKLFVGKGGVDLHQHGRRSHVPHHQALADFFDLPSYVTGFEQACLNNYVSVVKYLLQQIEPTIRHSVFDAIFWAGRQSMSELLSRVPILESNSDSPGRDRRELTSPNHVRLYHGWYISFDKSVPGRKEIDRLFTIDIVGNEEHEYVDVIRFSADGRYLTILTEDVASVYDSATGEQLQKLNLLHKYGRSPSISSSGLYIATSSGGPIQVSFRSQKW